MQPTDDTTPWTVQRLLLATRTFLAGAGVDGPRLDAELLLGHVLGLDRLQLILQSERPVSDDERAAYRVLVRRRASGEPVAYLLGSRGFWSIDLQVDARVLIPRPETEQIVEQVLRWTAAHKDAPWRIVDVGTGSGAIALALAKERPAAVVVATDTSPDALDVARSNATALKLSVHFVRGDLLQPLIQKGSQADIIVSNPPYIPLQDKQTLMRDVREHEPALALFGGSGDGLDIIRRLIPQAVTSLRPGGLFVMEFGIHQADAVRRLALPHFAKVAIHPDFSGIDRILVAEMPGTFEIPTATPSASGGVAPADAPPTPASDETAEAPTPPDSPEAALQARLDALLATYGVTSVDELTPQQQRNVEAALADLPVIDVRGR